MGPDLSRRTWPGSPRRAASPRGASAGSGRPPSSSGRSSRSTCSAAPTRSASRSSGARRSRASRPRGVPAWPRSPGPGGPTFCIDERMNALGLLFVLAFVVSVDLRIIAPVLPSIATSLHATAGAVGLAMTTYAVAYGSGQLVYGPLSDRYGRVPVVRLAALGLSVCTAPSALCATTWQFVAGRPLAGGFSRSGVPPTLRYLRHTLESAQPPLVGGA